MKALNINNFLKRGNNNHEVKKQGGILVEQGNKFGEIPLGNVSDGELSQIKELEQKLGNRFYLIAYDKNS